MAYYTYNGVKLPKIPARNEALYPHANLYIDYDGEYTIEYFGDYSYADNYGTRLVMPANGIRHRLVGGAWSYEEPILRPADFTWPEEFGQFRWLSWGSERGNSTLSSLKSLGFPFWYFFSICGVADKVLPINSDHGIFFDENGVLSMGLFDFYLNTPSDDRVPQIIRMYKLSEWSPKNVKSINVEGKSGRKIYYSRDYAYANPDFLTTACYYLDWERSIEAGFATYSTRWIYAYLYEKTATATGFTKVTDRQQIMFFDASTNGDFSSLNMYMTVKSFNLDGLSTFRNLFWTNFDVLNKDSSIYLEASEPVKVMPSVTEIRRRNIGYVLAGLASRGVVK